MTNFKAVDALFHLTGTPFLLSMVLMSVCGVVFWHARASAPPKATSGSRFQPCMGALAMIILRPNSGRLLHGKN